MNWFKNKLWENIKPYRNVCTHLFRKLQKQHQLNLRDIKATNISLRVQRTQIFRFTFDQNQSGYPPRKRLYSPEPRFPPLPTFQQHQISMFEPHVILTRSQVIQLPVLCFLHVELFCRTTLETQFTIYYYGCLILITLSLGYF